MTDKKVIHALDFDGVICDSAVETAHTGWRSARQIWTDMQPEHPKAWQIEAFRQIRPWLETGYEATLIMRLLEEGINADSLCADYYRQLQALVDRDKLDTDELKQQFGQTRDDWIRDDEAGWLEQNPLFDGVAERLLQLDEAQWYIVTTKQERFVERILESHGIRLAVGRIYGLDRGIGKQQALKQILEDNPGCRLQFTEDRLVALQGVANNPSLQDVALELVDWGYNTAEDKLNARRAGIKISLLRGFLFRDG